MKNTALPLLLALGLIAPPTLAQTQAGAAHPAAESGAAAGAETGTSGYGFSSGAPSGMRAEAGADMDVAQAELEMPRPQTAGDVTYLCGGIGATEASYMKQQARNYDLQLTFAAQTGAYLADVDVDIRSAQGDPILQVHCPAPIMLVDLPRSGSYRIEADAAGFTQTRTVRVNTGRGQPTSVVAVTWPRQAVAQMEAEAPVTTGGEERTSGAAPESDVPDNLQREWQGGPSGSGSGVEGAR